MCSIRVFVGSVRFIRVFKYVNVWVSIIQAFQLSEHSQVPMSLDKQGSTVLYCTSKIPQYMLAFCSCTLCNKRGNLI